MSRVAVIGGGIAGLGAAYRLHRSGVDVVLLESSPRVGGVIRSEKADGFLFEHGPNSVQTRTPELLSLIEDLDLEGQMVEASAAARVRYVVRERNLVPAPTSPPAFVSSKLFSRRAKLRLLREPFIRAAAPSESESVAGFVRRRFGPEVLDYGVNPFVAGVYAGDPEQLSIRHAFPRLYDLEQQHGSIIGGQIRHGLLRREVSSRAETDRESRKMFSFDQGLDVLTRRMAGELNGRIQTHARVKAVTQHGSLWVVLYNGGSETVNAVVYAAPLYSAAQIELPHHPAFERLSQTSYPPLSVVALGYDRQAVRHPLDGFGMLVPEKEPGLQILGTLFTSTIFPKRAPEGSVLLTSFVGGMRAPSLARMSSEELFSLVHTDLQRLLGIESDPTFRRHVFWPHAIPQYNLGYDATIEAIDRLEAALPGWFMAGNYRIGVAVGDALASGVTAADRCIDFISG